MDIKDLAAKAPGLSSEEFRRRLDSILMSKPKFMNLDRKNRQTVMEILKKHWERIRTGRGIPYDSLRRDCYNLYQKRQAMGLSEEDYEDVKDILEEFKG